MGSGYALIRLGSMHGLRACISLRSVDGLTVCLSMWSRVRIRCGCSGVCSMSTVHVHTNN